LPIPLQDEKDRQVSTSFGTPQSEVNVLTFSVTLLDEQDRRSVVQNLMHFFTLHPMLGRQLFDHCFQPKNLSDPHRPRPLV
jgi:hypothetical protein